MSKTAITTIDFSFAGYNRKKFKKRTKRKSKIKSKKSLLLLTKYLFAGFFLIFFLFIYNFAVTSPYFSLSEYRLNVKNRFLKKKLFNILDTYRGENIFLINMYDLKEKIEKIPEVEAVYIRKVFPNKLKIHIIEKKPFLILKNSKNFLIDDEGNKIEETYGKFEYKLPEIVADGFDEEALIELLPVEELKEFFFKFSDNKLLIHFNPTHGIVVIDDGMKIYLGVDNLVEKWDNYLKIFPELKKRFGDIEYIDLRFDGRVYIKEKYSDGGVDEKEQ